MASGPITSWKIDGETVEKVADFILRVRKSFPQSINTFSTGEVRNISAEINLPVIFGKRCVTQCHVCGTSD